MQNAPRKMVHSNEVGYVDEIGEFLETARSRVSEIVINFSTFWQMEKEGLLQEFDKERLKLEVELDFELDFLHR